MMAPGMVPGEKEEENPDEYRLKDLADGPINLRGELEKVEKAYIDRALSLADGNLSKASQLLGCTRFTLKRRMDSMSEMTGQNKK